MFLRQNFKLVKTNCYFCIVRLIAFVNNQIWSYVVRDYCFRAIFNIFAIQEKSNKRKYLLLLSFKVKIASELQIVI